jgi:hypothetical protein
MAIITICECGLAKCYHENHNPLAYRYQDGKVHCGGYTPRLLPFGQSAKDELELYKIALEMAAREVINPEGTFGEQVKRNEKKERWLQRARSY